MKPFRFLPFALLVLVGNAYGQYQPYPADVPSLIPPGYKVETIPLPEGVTMGIAGLSVAENGDVYCGTRFGQVWRYSYDGNWTLFADGLHEITGVLCDRKTGQIFAAQKPELTELIDENKDGVAEVYKSVTHGWGFLGNYHQFHYGPVRDSKGNFYGTLNLGHGGGLSVGGAIMTIDSPDRGTSYQVTPDGKYSTVSYGMRSPAGLVINPENDELFYTDNQGDWNATSALHHIVKGRFHGHPASLLYHPDFKDKDLNAISAAEYEKLRTRPAIWIPQGELANSPGNPVFDTTDGKFGPFGGQMFCGDQTRSNVFRLVLDKVGDDYQGVAINFIDHLQCGAIRLAFGPDGTLWVGQTSRGWGSVGGAPYGLQRIRFDGTSKPCELATVKLAMDGFDLTFTEPVDAATAGDPANYRFRHWGYLYHGNYGSPKVDEKDAPVTSATVSADGKSVHLVLPDLQTKKVYQLTLDKIAGKEGTPLTGKIAYYTLNRLR
jgi:hypothetical protein